MAVTTDLKQRKEVIVEEFHFHVLAIQTHGYIDGDDDMSPGAVATRARVLYAAKLVREGIIPKEGLFAVFPQGYRDPNRRLALGKNVEDYFWTVPELKGIRSLFGAMGWDTEHDVPNACQLVIGHLRGQQQPLDSVTVHFVSDETHIKRVEQVWNHCRPKGWQAKFYGSTLKKASLKERFIREPAARFIYWLKMKI